jgi:sulfate permease, SulP family
MLIFHPKILDAFKGYNRGLLTKDVLSGITVGIVALPLAMAFAIASGLKPEAGIFTAIVAGGLISLLGGSRVQIGGPAGAFIVIVYGIVERYGIPNLLLATVMSGVFLFLMGLMRLGTLVRFIPIAVIIGFTNGIACLIGISQIKDFFGLTVEKMPAQFFPMLQTLYAAADTVNIVALGIACFSLMIIVAWKLIQKKLGWLGHIPGTVVAMVIATLITGLFNLPVDTIGSRFGSIPSSLPYFEWISISWGTAQYMVTPALTLALLGAIESLLCARVADSLIHDRHDSNQELMAQGVANLVSPFFGGMPATGTIARTVTNIESGGTTPIAGIIHACTLLIIILFRPH